MSFVLYPEANYFILALTAYSLWSVSVFFFDCLRGKSTYNGFDAPVRFSFFENTFPLLFNYHRLIDFFVDCENKFKGKFWTFKVLFSPRYYVSSDPKNVEYVLKTNFYDFEKGPYLDEILHDLLGIGIFNNDGQSWYNQRKIASNIFNVKNFRDFFMTVFQEEAKLMYKILEKYIRTGDVIDLHDLFHRYTLNAFTKIGFGMDLHLLENFLEGNTEPVEFAKAFDELQALTDIRLFNPFWKVSEYLDGSKSRFKKAKKIIKNFSQKTIDNRRSQKQQDTDDQDLLGRFMKATSDEKGSKFNDDELCDIILNFIFAGRDTTAQTLSWAFYQLFHNPEEVENLKNEIKTILGDFHPLENEIPYESLKEFKYTKAIISETLRLHPSVPKQGKMALKDVVFPDGTKIPAGSYFTYSSFLMGRSKSIWGDDALEFKPKRFLDDPNPSPFKYPVFNAGPRICLGMNMAYNEALTVLITMFSKFNFQLISKESEIQYRPSLTLSMKNGIKVKVLAEELVNGRT